jgi:hypothetical protein
VIAGGVHTHLVAEGVRIHLADLDIGIHALALVLVLSLAPDLIRHVVTCAGAPVAAEALIPDITLVVTVPGASAVAQLIQIGLVEGLRVTMGSSQTFRGQNQSRRYDPSPLLA